MDDFSVSSFENNDYDYPPIDSMDNYSSCDQSYVSETEKEEDKNSNDSEPSDSDEYGITPASFTDRMDLNAALIQDKRASYIYLAREDNIDFVQKDSWLLVDRSLKHQVGDIVVIGVDGEVLLRRFVQLPHPYQKRYLPALITDREGESPIFLGPEYPPVFFKGVVRCIIHFCRPCQ